MPARAATLLGMSFRFEVLKTDPSGARLGRLTTPHGVIDTPVFMPRSEEHTSELQSRLHLVCRLLLEKKKTRRVNNHDASDSKIALALPTLMAASDSRPI